MKVKVGNEEYLMHWETRKFSPQEGNNTGLELEATDCIIRKVLPLGGTLEVARGHVSQTACDPGNSVTARRLSFLKAIGYPRLARPLRKALGHEYNRTCRVTSNDHGRTTRKLRKRIKLLEDIIIKNNLMTAKTLAGLIVDIVKSEPKEAEVQA